MGSLEGRVAIITGAGRGLGREHALLFAAEGAKVVVNDLGEVAEETAAEIRADRRRRPSRRNHDITAWDGGRDLVAAAVDAFGRLDVLVNNAGILRDRMLVSMSEEEWDEVVEVHLKGHFVPTRFAAAHWREQVKAGTPVQASDHPHVVDLGAARQPRPDELRRRQGGHRVVQHHLRPGAGALRRALQLHRAGRPHPPHGGHPGPRRGGGGAQRGVRRVGPGQRLAARRLPGHRDCDITGRTFFVQGGTVRVMEPWRMGERLERADRWTIDDLREQLPPILG